MINNLLPKYETITNDLMPKPTFGTPEFRDYFKQKIFEQMTHDLSDIKIYSGSLKNNYHDIELSKEEIKNMFDLKNKQLNDFKNNNFNIAK